MDCVLAETVLTYQAERTSTCTTHLPISNPVSSKLFEPHSSTLVRNVQLSLDATYLDPCGRVDSVIPSPRRSMVSPLDHVPNGDTSLDLSSTSLLSRGLPVLLKRPSRLVERLLPVVMVSPGLILLGIEADSIADSSKGYFVKPTVILTKDPKSVTMTKEIFGPVMTVCPLMAFKEVS